MKKILLAAVAALAIVGCTQNEEIEKAGEKAEINFGTVVKTGTRAAIITQSNFESFTVNAYKTSGALTAGSALTEFMKNLEVNKNKTTGAWEYSGTYYWPTTDFVHFFATSPIQSIEGTTGYPTFKYTVKDVASQEDLLAASLLDKVKANGEVVLVFQHLLTQVNFSIKGDTKGCTYSVSKLELKEVKNQATFTFAESATGTWSTSVSSTAPTNISYAYTPASPIVVTPGEKLEEVTKCETDGALFMLMPQDASAIKLEITYTATLDGDTQPSFDGVKVVTLNGTWDKGQNIRYTLNLTSDATAVSFGAPTVNPWIDEAGTTTDPVAKSE